jgi:hypothetical protein
LADVRRRVGCKRQKALIGLPQQQWQQCIEGLGNAGDLHPLARRRNAVRIGGLRRGR